MKNVLITGSNGFVGAALCERLLAEGWRVTAAVRRHSASASEDNRIRSVPVGDIGLGTDWTAALCGIDIVVHLAARAHVKENSSGKSLQAYRQANVEGTRNLAEQASRAGIKRFVYLSSIKVNGEGRSNPYSDLDAPLPEDAYGISKMEAEHHVNEISRDSGMEFVTIRPPLVYGPGVKANFLALMNLVARKVPLPLASVVNQRSFIYLGNLIDSIALCMVHDAAAGQTFLVSDDKDVSTPELIRLLAVSLEVPCLLFPFPPVVLKTGAELIGRGEAAKRLLGSLTSDISKIKNELAWSPPYSMTSGLQHTARWYKER